MAKIDIRTDEDETIDEIVYSERHSLRKTEGYVRIKWTCDDTDYDSIQIETAHTARYLIKALEKAIEMEWWD
jgi:hypothetical protein